VCECGDQAATANVLGSLADLANELGDPRLAARLFGAAKAIRDAIGTSHAADQIEDYERVLGLVRAAAGDGPFETAWAEGMAAPLDAIAREAGCLVELASATPQDPRDVALQQKTGLNARELAIVREFVAGKSNQEIAEVLGLNQGFVSTLIGQIYTKLGGDSRAGVTAFAFKSGIV
jgi:DNA-binding CsgD family transcriptional regulator